MTAAAQAGRPSKSIKSYLPVLEWLPKYQAAWLRPDLLVGLTIVALLLLEGMA